MSVRVLLLLLVFSARCFFTIISIFFKVILFLSVIFFKFIFSTFFILASCVYFIWAYFSQLFYFWKFFRFSYFFNLFILLLRTWIYYFRVVLFFRFYFFFFFRAISFFFVTLFEFCFFVSFFLILLIVNCFFFFKFLLFFFLRYLNFIYYIILICGFFIYSLLLLVFYFFAYLYSELISLFSIFNSYKINKGVHLNDISVFAKFSLIKSKYHFSRRYITSFPHNFFFFKTEWFFFAVPEKLFNTRLKIYFFRFMLQEFPFLDSFNSMSSYFFKVNAKPAFFSRKQLNLKSSFNKPQNLQYPAFSKFLNFRDRSFNKGADEANYWVLFKSATSRQPYFYNIRQIFQLDSLPLIRSISKRRLFDTLPIRPSLFNYFRFATLNVIWRYLWWIFSFIFLMPLNFTIRFVDWLFGWLFWNFRFFFLFFFTFHIFNLLRDFFFELSHFFKFFFSTCFFAFEHVLSRFRLVLVLVLFYSLLIYWYFFLIFVCLYLFKDSFLKYLDFLFFFIRIFFFKVFFFLLTFCLIYSIAPLNIFLFFLFFFVGLFFFLFFKYILFYFSFIFFTLFDIFFFFFKWLYTFFIFYFFSSKISFLFNSNFLSLICTFFLSIFRIFSFFTKALLSIISLVLEWLTLYVFLYSLWPHEFYFTKLPNYLFFFFFFHAFIFFISFFISNLRTFLKFIFQELFLTLFLFNIDLFIIELFFAAYDLKGSVFFRFFLIFNRIVALLELDIYRSKSFLALFSIFSNYITKLYLYFSFRRDYFGSFYFSSDKGEFSKEFISQMDAISIQEKEVSSLDKLGSLNSELLRTKSLFLSFWTLGDTAAWKVLRKKNDFLKESNFVQTKSNDPILNDIFLKDKFVNMENFFIFVDNYKSYLVSTDKKSFVFYKNLNEAADPFVINLADNFEFTKVSYFYFIRIFFFFEIKLLRYYFLWFYLVIYAYIYLRWSLFLSKKGLGFYFKVKNLFIYLYIFLVKSSHLIIYILTYLFYQFRVFFYNVMILFLPFHFILNWKWFFRLLFILGCYLILNFHLFYFYFVIFIFILSFFLYKVLSVEAWGFIYIGYLIFLHYESFFSGLQFIFIFFYDNFFFFSPAFIFKGFFFSLLNFIIIILEGKIFFFFLDIKLFFYLAFAYYVCNFFFVNSLIRTALEGPLMFFMKLRFLFEIKLSLVFLIRVKNFFFSRLVFLLYTSPFYNYFEKFLKFSGALLSDSKEKTLHVTQRPDRLHQTLKFLREGDTTSDYRSSELITVNRLKGFSKFNRNRRLKLRNFYLFSPIFFFKHSNLFSLKYFYSSILRETILNMPLSLLFSYLLRKNEFYWRLISFFGSRLNNGLAKKFFLSLYNEMRTTYIVSFAVDFDSFFFLLKRGLVVNQLMYANFLEKFILFPRKSSWYASRDRSMFFFQEKELEGWINLCSAWVYQTYMDTLSFLSFSGVALKDLIKINLVERVGLVGAERDNLVFLKFLKIKFFLKEIFLLVIFFFRLAFLFILFLFFVLRKFPWTLLFSQNVTKAPYFYRSIFFSFFYTSLVRFWTKLNFHYWLQYKYSFKKVQLLFRADYFNFLFGRFLYPKFTEDSTYGSRARFFSYIDFIQIKDSFISLSRIFFSVNFYTVGYKFLKFIKRSFLSALSPSTIGNFYFLGLILLILTFVAFFHLNIYFLFYSIFFTLFVSLLFLSLLFFRFKFFNAYLTGYSLLVSIFSMLSKFFLLFSIFYLPFVIIFYFCTSFLLFFNKLFLSLYIFVVDLTFFFFSDFFRFFFLAERNLFGSKFFFYIVLKVFNLLLTTIFLFFNIFTESFFKVTFYYIREIIKFYVGFGVMCLKFLKFLFHTCLFLYYETAHFLTGLFLFFFINLKYLASFSLLARFFFFIFCVQFYFVFILVNVFFLSILFMKVSFFNFFKPNYLLFRKGSQRPIWSFRRRKRRGIYRFFYRRGLARVRRFRKFRRRFIFIYMPSTQLSLMTFFKNLKKSRNRRAMMFKLSRRQQLRPKSFRLSIHTLHLRKFIYKSLVYKKSKTWFKRSLSASANRKFIRNIYVNLNRLTHFGFLNNYFQKINRFFFKYTPIFNKPTFSFNFLFKPFLKRNLRFYSQQTVFFFSKYRLLDRFFFFRQFVYRFRNADLKKTSYFYFPFTFIKFGHKIFFLLFKRLYSSKFFINFFFKLGIYKYHIKSFFPNKAVLRFSTFKFFYNKLILAIFCITFFSERLIRLVFISLRSLYFYTLILVIFFVIFYLIYLSM